MLTRKIAVYDFSRLQLSPLKDGSFLNGPFFLTFPAPGIPEAETTLLSIPDALTLRMIQRSFGDNPPGSTILYGGGVQSAIDSLRGEGVFYFNETDEWILEAAFTLYNKLTQEKETFMLRMPLSHPEMKGGEIGLYYDGTWLRFVKNGEVLNENKGHDCFMPSGPLFVHPSFADAAVAVADVVSLSYRTETEDSVGDFYMPHGFNAFAGDVMNFFHNGVYHVLYLLDRRHHYSCNGRGAHYIAHLTSKNLVDWEEQELAVPIAYPWQSFGTGTMVFHDGKYYMSYGLHSERYIWTPTHKLNNLRSDTESAIFSDADVCTEISYDDILINGKTPIGATYSVSTDGCHFSPSGNVYHTARNPSIYANETGGLTLWAGLGMDASHNGIWEAPYFGAPFVRSPEKHDDIAHPLIPYSTECPSLFDWNGYRYLIIGWSGYFRTRAPGSSEMIDAVAAGESVYDGLGVPMVCEYRNSRKLIAGWIRSIGWGSVILHRELIQESSGKLGMKWVSEIIP